MPHRNPAPRLAAALLTLLASSCGPGTTAELRASGEAGDPGQGGGGPRLLLGDAFVEFRPGTFQYALDRGSTSGRQTYLFGKNFTSLTPDNPDLDLQPHDDSPDDKLRVRLTLRSTGANPAGDIVVSGERYEIQNDVVVTESVTDTIHVPGIGTYTTKEYFDRVTSIETTGLGVDATMDVEWWDGHEQEMNALAGVGGVTEKACLGDYLVLFNGQATVPDWDPARQVCAAWMLAGTRFRGGVPDSAVHHRGVYFGIVDQPDDAFFSFDDEAADPRLGHFAPPRSRQDWLAGFPHGAAFFDARPEEDPWLRPILVQLERLSDGYVVDAARVMFTLAEDRFGNPTLVAMDPEAENAGAFAQLSPRGLDRLEPTHADTLPYPKAPPGTQPRLSGRAIALEAHRSGPADFDLADLPADDIAYWTEKNPTGGSEFAGYLAYDAIFSEAHAMWVAFHQGEQFCNQLWPLWLRLLCLVLVHTSCVESPPEVQDFRIHVDGIDSYFDPARPADALVVGDVTHMDLSIGGDDQILADFRLEDIQGWLEASIDPSRIRIEWDRPAGPGCVVRPAARTLSDFLRGTEDREGWLTCHDLGYASPSALLLEPIAFDVDPGAGGESLATPYAPSTPLLTLALPELDLGAGTCGEPFLADVVRGELLAWTNDIASALEAEIVASPGEDEALDRLLSPFELGVERVDAPPAGTPPYDVNPLDPYDLSARVGKAPADVLDLRADRSDGLYVPYLTRSFSVGALPYDVWFCPFSMAQTCDGLLGAHPAMFEDGLDPDGDPFDVALHLTTAHVNQALWAQARREDRLGSPEEPARLDIADGAVMGLAAALGFDDVVDALTALGTAFGVRFHHDAAPFTRVADANPPKLVYVVPNVAVELVSVGLDRSETVVAKFLVDVIDPDLRVSIGTGGARGLTAAWGGVAVRAVTTTFVPGCYGTLAGTSCDDRLRTVVGALWWPGVEGTLRALVEATPAPQIFDAGQESDSPRQLENARTFLDDGGLHLVANLCNPAVETCE